MPRILCTRGLMRIRNGALRCSIAWPHSAALGCVDAKDVAATECIAGASADSIGACSKRNSLADNACSHQARETGEFHPAAKRSHFHGSVNFAGTVLVEGGTHGTQLTRCSVRSDCEPRSQRAHAPLYRSTRKKPLGSDPKDRGHEALLE